MHTRLLEIMKYKTGGRQTELAELLGWKPQYLAKLLKGENFGLQPVLAIVTKFTEINARWLLTGEGKMIEDKKHTDIRKKMYENIIKVLDMEKYMPVMSPVELREFEQVITGRKKIDFSPETVEKWAVLLQERNEEINEKFKAANNKSKKLCNQRKAKK
jgi:transcriptional regulator with XRE-family HTH domain